MFSEREEALRGKLTGRRGIFPRAEGARRRYVVSEKGVKQNRRDSSGSLERELTQTRKSVAFGSTSFVGYNSIFMQ